MCTAKKILLCEDYDSTLDLTLSSYDSVWQSWAWPMIWINWAKFANIIHSFRFELLIDVKSLHRAFFQKLDYPETLQEKLSWLEKLSSRSTFQERKKLKEQYGDELSHRRLVTNWDIPPIVGVLAETPTKIYLSSFTVTDPDEVVSLLTVMYVTFLEKTQADKNLCSIYSD